MLRFYKLKYRIVSLCFECLLSLNQIIYKKTKFSLYCISTFFDEDILYLHSSSQILFWSVQ